MELNQEQLLEVGFDSASSAVDGMPAHLSDRVANLGEGGSTVKAPQHPGWSEPGATRISALSAFVDTAAELGTLLDTLAGEDWRQRTRVDGVAVRDLVEHLVGMERYLLGQLGRRPRLVADRREDHWPATRLAVADLVDEPNGVVTFRWWFEVMDLIGACGELGPDHPISYHHLAGNLHGLLVSRIFELWTHGDDIRQAIGQPLNLLDDARLTLMVSELMEALPIGVMLSGNALPGRSARFDITGSGGRTYDVALAFGEMPGAPDVIITADALELCRFAANRLGESELAPVVEGDGSLLDPVLVAVTAFAAD
jgi:uncharacterized protein (TIGR03083 family)